MSQGDERLDAPLLQDAGAYFRSVLEASQDCIRVLGVDGCVEYMNRRGQELFEIDDFEVNRGRFWPDLWPEEHRLTLLAALDEARAGGVATFRSHCPTAKGRMRWWETVVSAVSGEDQVIRLLARSRDITRELETEAFLDTIIQLLPSALIVKAADSGRYVLVNKAAEELLGYKAEEMLGKDAFDLFPQNAQAFAEEDRVVLASGDRVETRDEVVHDRTGRLRYYLTRKFVTRDPTGPRHIVAMAEDVTERRAAAQALKDALAEAKQASRAKSAFLANMSHEIRTPLNGVLAVADMLAREIREPRLREMAEIIRSSSIGLTDLLSDILDWARIDAGRADLANRPCTIGEAVYPAIRMARAQAQQKGLEFTAEVCGCLDTPVEADPDRLRQILSHMLSNAVKFTQTGKVALEIGCDRVGSGDLRRARFVVRDTGIGFCDEDRERLFRPFEQSDGSITRQFGGSGLGLSIARSLARAMGGDISAEGRPGEGAVFTFQVELRAAEQAAPPPAEAATETAAPVEAETEDRPLRVLQAEDHPVNRRVVEMIMQAVDADLTSVENGALAVEAVAAEPFDVILMDMQMPVMDGLTAIRQIREAERGRGAARTPIICLTANAMSQHREASLAAGADLHLPKPVTADSLIGAIRRVLSGAPAVDHAA